MTNLGAGDGMDGTREVQFAIAGAGIAGASLAAALAPHASIALLEMEARPGYHITRSSTP